MDGRSIEVVEISGRARVYDPEIQLPDCPHSFYWNPETWEMERYLSNDLGWRLRPNHHEQAKVLWLSNYLRWKQGAGVDWLKEEQAYYQQRARSISPAMRSADAIGRGAFVRDDYEREREKNLIYDILESRRIPHLYHFTDEQNIPLIARYGLLAWRELLKRNIVPPRPGGNELSREADAKKHLDRYVHLCLNSEHPMEYRAREDGRIGKAKFLKISCEVLYFKGVMGCIDVANKSGVAILPIAEALKEMDLEVLFSKSREFDDPRFRERFNLARKAEILVPSEIPPDLIYNL